jgi:hypothetical protein
MTDPSQIGDASSSEARRNQNNRPLWRRFLLLGALAIIVGLTAFAWQRVRDARGVILPDDPDEVTLFSIDGSNLFHPPNRDKPNGREWQYGWPVLGEVRIADPDLRRRVVNAVKQDLTSTPQERSLCFQPRHMLRMVEGRRTIDLLICYKCGSREVYVNGKTAEMQTSSVDKSSQELLNKILTDAGVSLSR